MMRQQRCSWQGLDDPSDEAILERLLALNFQRAAEETARPASPKPKASRLKTDDELL